MKKRVLMGLALFAIIGTSAVFAQQVPLDNLSFVANRDGNYNVQAKVRNLTGEVVIPDTYNGKPVVSIGTFYGSPTITNVIIPNSVTSITITANAFNNLTGLKSITIPASVTTIERTVFTGCTNLTSVTFQRSGTDLGNVNSTMKPFEGDLVAKYQAGGAGTYTRSVGGTVWTKQGGVAVCPTCGQPLPAGFKLP